MNLSNIAARTRRSQFGGFFVDIERVVELYVDLRVRLRLFRVTMWRTNEGAGTCEVQWLNDMGSRTMYVGQSDNGPYRLSNKGLGGYVLPPLIL